MAFEIIPNWHPIFVHFTVGLLSISSLFYLFSVVLQRGDLLIVARWNLWAGTLITIATVAAGIQAYNTVAHDEPSHAAMTDHRNWALVTAAVFAVLSGWSAFKRHAMSVSPVFLVLMLLATGLLGVTGYKGGEVVYRHGTGVMRLPEVQGEGDHASHTHEETTGHNDSDNHGY